MNGCAIISMNEIHIIIYGGERTVQKQPETPSEIIKAARDKSDLTVEELTDRVGITEDRKSVV